jgi:hypothetical protein
MSRGRPRRYKGIRGTSFYIPLEYEKLWDDFIQLSKIDNTSVSLEILKAVQEYVSNHHPGNPQTILPSHTGEAPLPVRLKVKWSIRDLESDLKILEQKRGSGPYQTEARKRVEKAVLELSSLSQRLNDSAIQATIEKALKVLEASNSKEK